MNAIQIADDNLLRINPLNLKEASTNFANVDDGYCNRKVIRKFLTNIFIE